MLLRFFLYCFLLLSVGAVVAQPLVTICYESKGYPPFSYQQQNQKQRGLLVDLVTTAAKQAKIDVNFIRAPWLRCNKLLEQNKVQATFAMIRTEEREQLFAFPDEQLAASERNRYLWLARYPIFIQRNKAIDFNSYQPNFGIGAPLGYVVSQQLADKGWLSPIQYNAEQGLAMVAANKLDGYVVEQSVGQHILKRLQLEQEVSASTWALVEAKWHVVFNQAFYNDNQARVELFWHQLNQLRISAESKFED